MVVDIAASAVGLALSLLCKYIEEFTRQYMYEKSMEFYPLLEKIKIKLEALQPVIKEIEQKNQELDRPDELKDFTKVIEDGQALVIKLKEVARWYKKPKYTNKLKELDESLHTQMMLLGVRSAREVANLSVIANINEGNTTNIRMQIGNVSMQMGSLSTQMDNMDMQMGDMGMQIGNLNTTHDNLVEMVKDMKLNCLVQNKAKDGWFGVPDPPPFTVGFEMHLDELKKKLVDDGKSMALITGHPGSGKTTLAKSFCQEKTVKGKFSSIIFVDVSKRPNTEVVQEICEKDGTPIPCFQTEEIALQRLQQLLNKKGQDPVLLVLDNVWPGNRTDSLLESFRTKESEMSNYKILVTSRYELPGFDVVRHVDELNDKDALSVLRYSARLAISSFIPEELQIKVVECCKRLPLAIEVVGRSLFGKDIVIWKDRVEAWSSGSSVICSEKQLRDCLQSSLDALGEENADIKECFMDCPHFLKAEGFLLLSSLICGLSSLIGGQQIKIVHVLQNSTSSTTGVWLIL